MLGRKLSSLGAGVVALREQIASFRGEAPI
jgi:hypothetical protein